MGNAKKILAKMRNHPQDWRIEDLKIVARRYGVDIDDEGGTSHVTFRHPAAGRLTVPRRIPIKPWYIREFIAYVYKLEDFVK